MLPALLVSIPAFSTHRNVDVVDGIVYEMWEFDDGSLRATVLPVDENWLAAGVKQYSGDIVLPESVTYEGITYPVEDIGYKAFAQCEGLNSIAIPPSIKTISGQAFWRSYNMKAVYISDLKAWCEIAFTESNPLEYAHNLYLDGELLTDIKVPEGITAIQPNAFHGGYFSTFSMPETVTSIGGSAFNTCEKLKTVVMSPNVETIGIFAFDYCKALEEIVIPEKVEHLERMTFFHCENLKKVVLHEGFREVGVQAFSDCYSLSDINFPSSLTTIGTSAFFGCTSLPDPVFPDGLKTIGNTAFYSIRTWHTINLPSSLEELGAASFFCDNLEIFTMAADHAPTLLEQNPPFPFTDEGKIVAGFPTGSLAEYSRYKNFMMDNAGNEKPRLDITLPEGITLEFTKASDIDKAWPWGKAQDQTSLFVPKFTQMACRIPTGADKTYRVIFNGEEIAETTSGSVFKLPYFYESSSLQISSETGICDIEADTDSGWSEIFTIEGRPASSDRDLPAGIYIIRGADGSSKKIIK